MGGLREDTIEATPTKSKSKSGSVTSHKIKGGKGGIRFHEDPNTGQVHFHDDVNGIKVGVPVADWYTAWRRLKHADHKHKSVWTYTDTQNGTFLTVRTKVNKLVFPHTFTCSITITPLSVDDNFKALEKFVPAPAKK